MSVASRLTGGRSAPAFCVGLFLVVLAVAPHVMADATAAAEGDVAYAAPMSIGTVALQQDVHPEDTVRRTDGPSSLVLLAMGLVCLYVVHRRHWVR